MDRHYRPATLGLLFDPHDAIPASVLRHRDLLAGVRCMAEASGVAIRDQPERCEASHTVGEYEHDGFNREG